MKPNYKRVNLFKASKSIRFYNFIIDYIIILILNSFVGMLIGFLYLLTKSVFVLKVIYSLDDKLIQWLFGAIILVLYYFLFEYFSKGKTIGKILTGTKVVDINGLPATQMDFFVRSISRLVPFEMFSFLFGVNSGWHDKWSDTTVVHWTLFKEAVENEEAIEELGKAI